jgi:hypothetical protein
MKMKLHLIIFHFLLISIGFSATPEKEEKEKKYNKMLGIVATSYPPYSAVGLQGELKFTSNIGIRLIGIRVFGYKDKDEYSYGAFLAGVYHIPIKYSMLDPFIGLGGTYSYNHWEWKLYNVRGNVQDISYAGGLGVGLILSKHIEIGSSIWLYNAYKKRIYWNGRAEKIGRKLIPLPVLELNILLY